MAERKSIEHYRNMEHVKTPVLAWALDRSWMYIPVLALALLIIGAMIADGLRAWEVMAAEPEDNSPYLETEARDFLGKEFAADFVGQYPESIDEEEWNADEVAREPSPIVSSNVCSEMGTSPNSLLTNFRGQGDGLRTEVRIFGAGQAKRYFEDVGSILEFCDAVSEYEENDITHSFEDEEYSLSSYSFVSEDDEHTVFIAGDAIITVQGQADDAEVDHDEAVEFYSEYAVESLNREQWQCINIDYAYDDYSRSFYHDFERYEGLFETETLEATMNTENLPSPALTREGNNAAEDSINTVDYPNLEEPESPLPDNFNDLPENEPQRPQLPLEFELRDDFSDTAYYEIPDYDGPGCGWHWSAQISPTYDEETLHHNREVVRTQVQNDLEMDAESYVHSGFHYALRTLREEPIITRWNEHVNTVNSIHEDWMWLEEQRDILWDSWQQYLSEHEVWSNFPSLQQEAQEEYNQELDAYDDEYAQYEQEFSEYEQEYEECMLQREQYDNWFEDYADLIREGEAVEEGDDPWVEEYDEEEEEFVEVELPTVPERPEDCSSLPSEPSEPSEPSPPAILSEDRGPEPSPPNVPEGVTVPDSWDNPNP